MNKKNRTPAGRLSTVVMLFYLLAFLLLALRDHAIMGYILAGAVPCMIFAGTHLLPHLFPTDRLLMSLTNFLCALGVLLLYEIDPALALQQVIFYGVGLVAMIICVYLVREIHSWSRVLWIFMPVSLLLLLLPLVMGPAEQGVMNRITLGGFSFQPDEFIRLTLVLVLAWYQSQRRVLPWLAFVLACLAVMLFLQKDSAAALLIFAVTLFLFWTSSGNLPLTLIGLALGGGAVWYGYQSFVSSGGQTTFFQSLFAGQDNVSSRVVQGLSYLAEGGWWGTGLGSPSTYPAYAYESEMVFTLLCRHFGLIFGGCVLLVYLALIWRGASIAISARRSFHGLLAMGAALMLGLQTLICVGIVARLIPLSDFPFPFLSYGGTSLISGMCLAGLMQGVASLNEDDLEEDTHLAMLERN